EGITGNDNDTTLPTSAAVKDYADTKSSASKTETLTNKTIDANGTGNSITNLEVADFASGVVDTDLSSVSGSDDTLPSAKATKTYVDNTVSNAVQGISWKSPVRVATTTAGTLASDFENGDT